MNTFHLFDLDGTVIDSFHRIKPCLKENGDLDLNKYKKGACQHSLIMQDELLPLIDYMKELIKSGEQVGICTARFMNKSDYYFLRKNGIKTSFIASRDQLHKHFDPVMAQALIRSGDAVYKAAWLQRVKVLRPELSISLYDDHDGVIHMARSLGVTCFDSKALNNRLDAAFKAGMLEIIEQLEREGIDNV